RAPKVNKDGDNMELNTIDFHCFSGTGNTLLVVQKMKEVFERNNVKVNIYSLEKANQKNINVNHAIGLGSPVAEQRTYPLVWDFIKSLPKAEGTPIFMVDTLMVYSGGIVGPVKRIMKNKGYTPIGAKEIPMPNNLFPRRIIQDKKERKIQKGLVKAEQFANDILDRQSKWVRIPVLPDLMSLVSRKDWSWSFFRAVFRLKIDKGRCKQCGLCAKLCPIDNIEIKEYPEIKDKCVYCMRCISFCPTRAIYKGKNNYQRHRAVNANELLEEESV
ncbi:MAG: EFR1 family ferrodoxin, partial [Thermoplasmatales archaeon]|nr:EFR1 family ferrodoxin [Thermoplasmatales archaeon]